MPERGSVRPQLRRRDEPRNRGSGRNLRHRLTIGAGPQHEPGDESGGEGDRYGGSHTQARRRPHSRGDGALLEHRISLESGQVGIAERSEPPDRRCVRDALAAAKARLTDADS